MREFFQLFAGVSAGSVGVVMLAGGMILIGTILILLSFLIQSDKEIKK